MHKTAFTAKTPDATWVDLPITIGVRIRLDPEQKQLIKSRFDELSVSEANLIRFQPCLVVYVSPVSTPALVQAMGCDRITLSAVLASNDPPGWSAPVQKVRHPGWTRKPLLMLGSPTSNTWVSRSLAVTLASNDRLSLLLHS